MAIEFRDVTQLEPLEALEDGDYLVVVRDGVAKRISKADAKFSGGAMIVTFTVTDTGISADKTVEEVTMAMATMPVIGNLILSTTQTPQTLHLGACCAELYNVETPTPAFGPFIYDSKESLIIGTIGVDSNGQWASRDGGS